ncbi:MAG: U32 family peptidase [Candidatus Omnitrophota bacterium]|nr:MAG: U32 family peptidase [Candidatus Omnitrophota bacterium]
MAGECLLIGRERFETVPYIKDNLMLISKPELVCPAGDWSALLTVVENGADSVYFGIKGLNMRNMAANFDVLELKKIMNFLHKNNKRGYLALNVIVFDRELKKIEKILKYAKIAQVDAVILWDMAIFSLAKKIGLCIHLSTQASVANTEAAIFFAGLGAERIVLARECTLSDIKNISTQLKKNKIRCEIEAFVHGAMCISISGRCFLSAYSSGKSANRGECWQYCRREFLIKDETAEADYVLGKDYLLSAKDLCTIDFIGQLIDAGITSFKIEGRGRASDYLKVVTSVYRKAIDAYANGCFSEQMRNEFKQKLDSVFNRGFSTGFYFGQPQNAISRSLENTYLKVFLGEVVKFYKKINVAEIIVRNQVLKKGDKLLFTGKHSAARFVYAEQLQQNHNFVEQVKKGEYAGIKLPFQVKPKDKVFLFQKNSYTQT